MRKFFLSKISASIFLSTLILTGCSSSKTEKELEPVELGIVTAADTPEVELVRQAQNFYSNKLFTNARQTFEKIRDGYPFGPYAEYAEIKVADCYFYTFEYATAALLYSDFAKQHPASNNLPYALIMAGRSNQLQYGGAGRDVAPLQKAIESYKDLLKRYPSSMYSGAAVKFLEGANKELIDHETLVADFYKRAGKEKAAEARMARAQDTGLTVAKEVAELHSTQKVAASAIEVPTLFRGRYTDPIKKAGAGEAKASLSSSINTEKLKQEATYRILRVNCKSEQDQIFVYTNKQISDEDLKVIESKITVDGDTATISIPKAYAEEAKLNCFADNDLLVSESGQLKIRTGKKLSLWSLNNPDRLLISFE